LFEEGKSGVNIVEMDSYKQILQRRVDIGAEYPVFGHWDAKEFTNEESGAKQALKAIGAGRTAVDIATGAGNLAITGRRLGGVSGGGTGVAGPKGGPPPNRSPQRMEDLQRFQDDLTHALKKSGIDITGAKGTSSQP
jgi:hypothetical protein